MVSSFTNDGVTPPAPELDVKWSGPRVVGGHSSSYRPASTIMLQGCQVVICLYLNNSSLYDCK